MNLSVSTTYCRLFTRAMSTTTGLLAQWSRDSIDNDMQRIYSAGIEAVRPASLVERVLQYDQDSGTLHCAGRSYALNRNVKVIAFGKAVLGMTLSLAGTIKDHIVGGVVSVPVGSMELAHSSSCLLDLPLKIYEGAPYNLPDERSLQAGRDALLLARAASADDLIITLLSGGGSALLPLPLDGISLEDKTKATVLLARAGASITELNVMRQCLSQLKGGKLALAMHPAQVLSLILSDVVGDPLHVIASGPTVPSQVTPAAVQSILSAYQPKLPQPLPASVTTALHEFVSSSTSTLPNSDDLSSPVTTSSVSSFSHVHNVLIGNNAVATNAAASIARELGYDVIVWSHDVEGEARELGRIYAKLATVLLNSKKQCQAGSIGQQLESLVTESRSVFSNQTALKDFVKLAQQFSDGVSSKKLCLISGGEPTVTVTGNGVGGRNQELALSFACCIHSQTSDSTASNGDRELEANELDRNNCGLLFGCLGTDGQDGPCDSAGAVVDMETWSKALEQEQHLDPETSLLNNDSHTFFSKLDCGRCLINTGLTGTNVMDIHIMLLLQ